MITGRAARGGAGDDERLPELDERWVDATLGSVLKYREDQERVRHGGIGELVKAAVLRGG